MGNQSKIAFFIVSKIRKSGEVFYVSDPFFFFALRLAEHFGKSIFVCPILPLSMKRPFSHDQNFCINHLPAAVEIVQVRPLASMVGFLLKLPVILLSDFGTYLRVIKGSRVILLRLPAPHCIIAFPLAKMFDKTIVTYYASDIKNVVFSGDKYKGAIKAVARLSARIVSGILGYLVEKSDATIFLSRELQRRHSQKNSHYAFASLISKDDIVERTSEIWSARAVSLIYAGRLTHEKGLAYLLRSLSILSNAGIEARLTLCGEGPSRSELEQRAENLGLAERVVFTGYIVDRDILARIFLEHDVFVLPSISEGTPKVLIEAMARGLVIVATGIGGIPDIITDHENGLLVPAKSEEEIAGAVKEILENQALRKKLRDNGYTCARNFTEVRQAQKISRIINTAVLRKERNTK